MTDVQIKDRKIDIEYLRMALNMVELGISYKHADLVNRVVNKVRAKKGKFSVVDSAKILSEWHTDWQQYDEEQKAIKEEKK